MNKRNKLTWIWLLSLALLLVACGGRGSAPVNETGVLVEVAVGSTAVGETALTVTLKEADGRPVTDAALDVRGDMSHAGMTPVIRRGLPTETAGVYTVPFDWTMSGDWFVTIEFTLPDGRSGSEIFDFRISTGEDE